MLSKFNDPALVNLNPHAVHIFEGPILSDGPNVPHWTIPASGTVARLVEDSYPTEHTFVPETFYYDKGRDGRGLDFFVRTVAVDYGTVADLPDPNSHPNAVYIVSLVVAQACPRRTDLVFPYPLLRDAQGRIIGCLGFGRVASSVNPTNPTNPTATDTEFRDLTR